MNKYKIIYILIGIVVGLLLSSTLFYVIQLTDARQGCCSYHNGVCSYTCPDGVNIGHHCCDGTSLSATCAPYYSSCPAVSKPKSEPESETEPKIGATDLFEVSALVVSITDGDTIKAKIEDSIYPVRIIGIDTPETVDPRKPVQCFGKEATNKLTFLISNKTITLKRDDINDNKDIYNRLLRYIYLDGVDIGAEMIKQGYAYAYLKYDFNSNKMVEYKNYENQARKDEVGLWEPGVCDISEEEKEDGSVEGVSQTKCGVDLQGVCCATGQICVGGNFINSDDCDLLCCVGGECINLPSEELPPKKKNYSGIIIVSGVIIGSIYYLIKRRDNK